MTVQAHQHDDNNEYQTTERGIRNDDVYNLSDSDAASLPPVPEEGDVEMDTSSPEEVHQEQQVEEITTMAQLSKLIASLDNPIRDISVALRGQVDDFIESNLREPTPIKLVNVNPVTVSVRDLHDSLHQASRELEEIFTNDSDRSPFGISFRSFAQNLQSSVDSFRVYLVRAGYLKGVPSSAQSEILYNCLKFKSELSSSIQELDAYVYKHTISALGSDEE